MLNETILTKRVNELAMKYWGKPFDLPVKLEEKQYVILTDLTTTGDEQQILCINADLLKYHQLFIDACIKKALVLWWIQHSGEKAFYAWDDPILVQERERVGAIDDIMVHSKRPEISPDFFVRNKIIKPDEGWEKYEAKRVA